MANPHERGVVSSKYEQSRVITDCLEQSRDTTDYD